MPFDNAGFMEGLLCKLDKARRFVADAKADMKATPSPECRVGHIWRTEKTESWQPIDDIGLVRDLVDAMNAEYGSGTHWVEYR